jgi:plastocyanin
MPKPAPIQVTQDAAFCGKHNLVDEKVVINPANNGVANVAVFLSVARGGKKPPVHDSYKESEKGSVVLDNENCRFSPRVVTMRTTQTLLVGNKDPVGHNTNITAFRNQSQNVLIPPASNQKWTFPVEETTPMPVACNIHPWMRGYVLVKENPYAAVSDAEGKVLIKNLPAGSWTFQIWHETGYVTAPKLGGKPADWKLGRVTLDIKAGMNDLGEIKLAPSEFQ